MFAKLTHDVRRDPTAIFAKVKNLGPADKEILEREHFLADVRQEHGRDIPAGRPWTGARLHARSPAMGVPLDQIRVPIEIWHSAW